MKIIQATKAYSPHIGGIETTVKNLAEGFVLRGHESEVLACGEGMRTKNDIINNVSVCYTSTVARVFSLPLSPSYFHHLHQSSGDILAIHEPFLLGPLAYLLSLKHCKKNFKHLVIWWHSDIARQKIFLPIYRRILTKILDECDAVVVATPNHISSSNILKDFAGKCSVIHHGIDPLKMKITPEIQLKINVIKNKYQKPIILFTGRLVYYKGVEYLVQAMQNLPEAHLIVVGRGVFQDKLTEIAATCPNNISFVPFLPQDDLTAMYQACDIFVLPSVENSEAYGLVQLEAMACGKPVITCDLPTGVTYVNQDGVTGLVVPVKSSEALAHAIKTLINHPDLRNKFGETARNRVLNQFTVDNMVDQSIDLYQSMLM
jgi:glycosyltransferase involved in cell wall biosynthesis